MTRKYLFLPFFIVALGITGMALAQPGGNRPGGGRDTPAAPNIQATPVAPEIQRTLPGQPTIAATRAMPQPTFTVAGQIPVLTPGGRQIPVTPSGDWMSSIALPEDMPSSAEEVQAALQNADVPYDISLEDMQLPPSSEVAYTAVVGFGQTYPGITVAPLYAAEFNTATAATRPRPVQQLPADMSAELEAITSQFPEEIQTMLANASGIACAALMSDGVAVVVTGDCTGAQCSISIENIQFEITQGSLGAYGFYRPGVVSDASAALTLVKATFPALNTVPLTQTTVASGYAFTAISGEMSSASVIAYYAGTVAAGQYTLVYAAVGVGQGYAELVR